MTTEPSLSLSAYHESRWMTSESVGEQSPPEKRRRPSADMAVPVAADFSKAGEEHRCER